MPIMRRRRKVLHVFPCIFHDFPWTSTTFRVGYAAKNPPEGPQMQGALYPAIYSILTILRVRVWSSTCNRYT